MSFNFINPESLGAPRGYSNGVLTDAGGRLLFIAGQVAWNQQQQIVSDDLVEQFDRALANLIAVISEARGTPEQIARLIIYVTDKDEYKPGDTAKILVAAPFDTSTGLVTQERGRLIRYDVRPFASNSAGPP